MSLVEEAIAAHGGLERWRQIQSLEVVVRTGGIALPLKGQPDALRRFRATAEPSRPHVEFEVLGHVRRRHAAAAGHGAADPVANRGRRAHFAGYALWGCLTVPFVFADEDVEVRELPRRRLRVHFPDRIPAHSKRQIFHFDGHGVLGRLD